nr:MAG TPA: nucelotide kinase [Caudoviricetes sp.]
MVEITEKDLVDVPLDNVNHPSHYETGKIECIDVMLETQGEESVKAFCICNAMKYLYRHKKKNGREDIAKAKWYLEKYLELEEWGDK